MASRMAGKRCRECVCETGEMLEIVNHQEREKTNRGQGEIKDGSGQHYTVNSSGAALKWVEAATGENGPGA